MQVYNNYAYFCQKMPNFKLLDGEIVDLVGCKFAQIVDIRDAVGNAVSRAQLARSAARTTMADVSAMGNCPEL